MGKTLILILVRFGTPTLYRREARPDTRHDDQSPGGRARLCRAVVKSTAATAEQPSITALPKTSALVAAISAASTAQAHSWAAAPLWGGGGAQRFVS